jgi:hypothetical protein
MTDIFSEILPKDQHYMMPAFVSLVDWASRQENILSDFYKKFGIRLNPKETIMDNLIDKATGFDEKISVAFVNYVLENYWGVE